jgi:hypothetical protein
MKTKIIPRMIFLAASLIPLAAAAQASNPFQAAKDAYNKAKQQLQQAQPQAQPQAQQSAPAQSPQPPGSPSEPTQAPGQHWWLCQYADPKDFYKPVLGSRVYFSVFPSFHSATDSPGEVGPMAYSSTMVKHFIGYVRQNYKVTDLPGDPTGQYAGRGGGRCARVSDDDAGRANTIEMSEKQWASSTPHIEAVQVNFADGVAQDAAIDRNLASAAPAAPRPTMASTGGSFISCATSGGAGIDTYLTGVFQTTRAIRHLPSGGDLVDQSILDDFYAYLKQKGYNFKPGSNYACDVSPTGAEAKAAQHKRHYEGGGCSTCGKTVQTGWKET